MQSREMPSLAVEPTISLSLMTITRASCTVSKCKPEMSLNSNSYDDENAIKERHFNSQAFQSFAAYALHKATLTSRKGQNEGVNLGPPTIRFAYMRGGWLTP